MIQEHQASPSETDDSLNSPLHAFGVSPHYDWTPDLLVKDRFVLDRDFFTAPMLTDADRISIIDNYPPIRGQIRKDNNLKPLQYPLSGGFRPLDILDSEIIKCFT